jgi:GNAT superfamily N-acetyltransferase
MPQADLNSSEETKAFVLRQAGPSDLAAISRLVSATLKISNAADYSPETIERILIDFTPEALAESFPRRTVWVALQGGAILGTASLEGSRVHTFFIAPQAQRRGCGAALFARLEAQARNTGEAGLCVRSSVTARSFYEKHGFAAIRAETINGIATVWMEKPFADPLRSSSPSSARSPA